MKERLTEILQNNIWLNLIFLILAILGILLTIYTYMKSKKRKSGVYNFRSFPVLSGDISSISKLHISYDGSTINNLTTSYFAIWNKGNSIIEKTDIAPIEPLKLSINQNCKIFEIQLITTTNPANNFSFSLLNQNEILVGFDYFAKNEGAVIKIQHSGKDNSDFKVLGTIKGVGKFKKGVLSEDFYLVSYLDYTIGWLKNYFHKNNKPFWVLIVLIILTIPQIPIILILIAVDTIKKVTNVMPKTFNFEGYE